MMLKRVLALTAAATLAVVLAGCGDDDPADDLEDAMEDAAEEMEDNMEDAADALEDAVD